MWLVGKNLTNFGQMVWEIWPFEVQENLKMNWSYLANHTWELSVLGLFGNGKTRSSTFMLGKNSFEACIMMQVEDQEVSIFGSWNYRSSCYFGKSSDLLQILPWCWLLWHKRPIRTWINSFKPFLSIKSKESTTVDQLWLSRVLDLTVHFWWIPNPSSLRLWLQMMSQVVWTLDYWPWCPNSTRMATIHCFDWLLTF